SKVNSTRNDDRNTDRSGEREQLKRADDRVHHSAARYPDRGWQFGEEVPVHGTGAVSEKVKKDETQWRDHKKRRNERDRRCQAAFGLAPGMIVCSFQMHRYWTARVVDVVLIVCRRSCASKLARIVVP